MNNCISWKKINQFYYFPFNVFVFYLRISMFLTENKWLSLFNIKKNETIVDLDLDEFINSFQVKSTRLWPLKEALSEVKYKPDDLHPLLDFYNNRDVYLKRFYKNNLSVPFQLNNKGEPINNSDLQTLFNFSKIKPEITNTRYSQYKSISRNVYYKQILEETNTIQGNVPSFL